MIRRYRFNGLRLVFLAYSNRSARAITSQNLRRFSTDGTRESSAKEVETAPKPIYLNSPAQHYPRARRIRRQIHLHIGPTNSGKSYNALLAFKAAQSGYYAGPLRMLAREIYDRLEAEGVPCNLVTGDEILEKEGAKLNSGTVEMIDIGNEMELAVIDEIQMIEDPDRGWAWTRALLGVRAKTIHLCGDPSSLKIVKEIIKETGDELTIHEYERLSPLKVSKTPLLGRPGKKPVKGEKPPAKSLYSSVQPGDCIVCFSKKEVQNTRDKIVQAHGNRMCCSIVYGSLPPETRAEQARLFNNHAQTKVDYLVASDAIGMGLNLAIKRIIFTSLKKFDGNSVRMLEVSEIKQISGRAGRFRTADGSKGDGGVVACVNADDIAVVRKALASPTPVITHAVLMPPPQLIRSSLIGDGRARRNRIPFSVALAHMLEMSIAGKNYIKPRQKSTGDVAALADRVQNLTFEDRMVLANAPVPIGNPIVSAAFTRMCQAIGSGRSVNVLELFPELMMKLASGKALGQTLETIHKILTLFLWVSYRFPCNFADRTGAIDLKRLCEAQFDTLLSDSKRKLVSPGGNNRAQFGKMSNMMMMRGSSRGWKPPPGITSARAARRT